MRKQFILENLDCAHCAMKMEEAARKVPGVEFISVNFLSMKLTLEAEDAVFDRTRKEVEAACRAVEPDVLILEEKFRISPDQKAQIWQIAIAFLLFLAAKILEEAGVLPSSPLWSVLPYLPSYLLAGYDVLRKAILGIFHGKVFDENFLMALATVGAFAAGEGSEGVMVMLLYCVGEFFQGVAVSKSRRGVAELMDIRPDSATRLARLPVVDIGVHFGQDQECLFAGETERRVKPENVPVDSLILVKPGEKVPLDGVIEEGNSFLDTVALTGESTPREVKTGDPVAAGCINMNGVLRVRTKKEFGESTVSKILSLIENATDGASKAERFMTRFARYYTPAVVILSLTLALIPPLMGGMWEFWLHQAVTCLVISCPCALVISVPLTFFSGIGSAGREGILIKSAESVERLAKADSCVFDKTGTLTQGVFAVTSIHPEVIGEEELLEIAAACEYYSDHPISLSLKAAFNHDIDKGRIGKIEETPGEGVSAVVDGEQYFVGNETLMKHHGVLTHPCEKCDHTGSLVHIAKQNQYLGHIVISDKLRPDAEKAILSLRRIGISEIALLSGDKQETADAIGKKLALEKIYGDLLPQDKYRLVEEMAKNAEKPLIFVGDGINDAPVLAKADLGIAMGGIGADAAVEAADVVIIDDKPSKVALACRIAKKTLGIVWQNIFFSVGIKLLVLIPNIFLGEESVPLWLAIFADVGVCLLAILNAARALHIRKEKS